MRKSAPSRALAILVLRPARVMERDRPLTEFTATPIPFAQFCQGPAWREFPLQIKLALLHLRRVEQDLAVNTALQHPSRRASPG